MEGTHPGKRPRAGACYEPADVAKARALAQRREEEKGDEGGRGAAVGLLPWQNTAARICRVSRASGGKDRHSKVLTAKGLRDRRVRLSVSTAIQFYDLQDRLGYDQPSKAVEWLIKAASAAIAELPSLDGAFAELSSRLARRAQNEGVDGLQQHYQQQQHLSLTKSTCSSTSETSRGSVLSLSRCDSHAKAREKAKERTSGEKGERQHDIDAGAGTGGSSYHQSAGRNPTSQCSFTDLLTGSNCQEDTMVTVAQANSNSDPNPGVIQIPHGYVHRHMRAVTADYFDQKPPHLQGVPAHFVGGGGSGSSPMPFGFAHTAGDGEHAEIPQQLPFLQDHLGPVTAVAGNGGDYSLNFSIASGLTGFNRGTLQSNSPSLFTHHAHHHLQRIPSQVADAGGTSLPFFFSTMHPVVTTTSGENSFAAGIDGRLQICYGDGYRHSDIKGKEKN